MKKITAFFLAVVIFAELIIISGCSQGKGKKLQIKDIKVNKTYLNGNLVYINE